MYPWHLGRYRVAWGQFYIFTTMILNSDMSRRAELFLTNQAHNKCLLLIKRISAWHYVSSSKYHHAVCNCYRAIWPTLPQNQEQKFVPDFQLSFDTKIISLVIIYLEIWPSVIQTITFSFRSTLWENDSQSLHFTLTLMGQNHKNTWFKALIIHKSPQKCFLLQI